jgi:hypothetical protein
MAKKKPEFRDMNDKSISVGSRVELHPGMDLWMRGARYGTITRVRSGMPCVRMDNSSVRKLVCVVPDRLKKA